MTNRHLPQQSFFRAENGTAAFPVFGKAAPDLDLTAALHVRRSGRELELIVNGGGPELLARLQQYHPEALTTESHVRYAAPAYFDDRLRIHARCGELRGARFRFEYVNRPFLRM